MLDDFSKQCLESKLSKICKDLVEASAQALSVNNGNIPRWEKAIELIKAQPQGSVQYATPYLKINSQNIDKEPLESSLKQLMPWRKGPYQIGNLQLDSEWRGDMKWDRVTPHIKPLKDKTVLDVGAGNGYFTYLMALSGAKITLGIEPFLLFNYQFQAIRSLIHNPPNAFVLPLKLEQIPYKDRDHALYVAYGPYKNPRYALSIIVEHGGSGSKAAAPMAKELFKLIIDRDELRDKQSNFENINI